MPDEGSDGQRHEEYASDEEQQQAVQNQRAELFWREQLNLVALVDLPGIYSRLLLTAQARVKAVSQNQGHDRIDGSDEGKDSSSNVEIPLAGISPSRVSRPRGYLALAGISPLRVSRPCGYRALAGISPLRVSRLAGISPSRVSRPCGYRALRVSRPAGIAPCGFLPSRTPSLPGIFRHPPSDYVKQKKRSHTIMA